MKLRFDNANLIIADHCNLLESPYSDDNHPNLSVFVEDHNVTPMEKVFIEKMSIYDITLGYMCFAPPNCDNGKVISIKNGIKTEIASFDVYSGFMSIIDRDVYRNIFGEVNLVKEKGIVFLDNFSGTVEYFYRKYSRKSESAFVFVFKSDSGEVIYAYSLPDEEKLDTSLSEFTQMPYIGTNWEDIYENNLTDELVTVEQTTVEDFEKMDIEYGEIIYSKELEGAEMMFQKLHKLENTPITNKFLDVTSYLHNISILYNSFIDTYDSIKNHSGLSSETKSVIQNTDLVPLERIKECIRTVLASENNYYSRGKNSMEMVMKFFTFDYFIDSSVSGIKATEEEHQIIRRFYLTLILKLSDIIRVHAAFMAPYPYNQRFLIIDRLYTSGEIFINIRETDAVDELRHNINSISFKSKQRILLRHEDFSPDGYSSPVYRMIDACY